MKTHVIIIFIIFYYYVLETYNNNRNIESFLNNIQHSIYCIKATEVLGN